MHLTPHRSLQAQRQLQQSLEAHGRYISSLIERDRSAQPPADDPFQQAVAVDTFVQPYAHPSLGPAGTAGEIALGFCRPLKGRMLVDPSLSLTTSCGDYSAGIFPRLVEYRVSIEVAVLKRKAEWLQVGRANLRSLSLKWLQYLDFLRQAIVAIAREVVSHTWRCRNESRLLASFFDMCERAIIRKKIQE